MHRGLTLIETVVAISITGVLMAAAFNVVGVSVATRAMAGDRVLGDELAGELMSEIYSQSYNDPQSKSNGTGPEGNEVGSGKYRSAFDDLDDYNGWKSEPPRTRDGTIIACPAGISRAVEVTTHAAGTPPLNSLPVEYRSITVTVYRGTRKISELTTYRTALWDSREEP